MSGAELTIVIPALNEEASIGSTIERCLAARGAIAEGAGVARTRIVVVSDGSTDRTAAIARSYAGVSVLEFPKNRGYGAAIQAGWAHAPAELLAFLDADGTCDPLSFVPMCDAVLNRGFEIALGSRMGPGSRMPWIRRVGNSLFAFLLGHLSRQQVHDAASGMRVLRAESLSRLLPLPNGLHFTPAMSARARMEGLAVAEIDMPYAERVGHSKLKVLRDGVRFLNVIVGTAAFVRVSSLTTPVIFVLSGLAGALMVLPTAFYLEQGRLEEWMFYRIAFAGMVGTIAVVVLCATIVTEHVSALTLLRYGRFQPRTRGLWRYENLGIMVALAVLMSVVAAALNLPGILNFLTTGHVTLHWSRVMIGCFIGINFAIFVSTLATLRIVRALHERQPFLQPEKTDADPPRAAPGERALDC